MDDFGAKYSGSLFQAADILREMASYSRLLILKNLAEKGPMKYSALKNDSKFKTKAESGKFAYHLRNLQLQKLVYQNDEKEYAITNRGTVFFFSSMSAIGLSTGGEMGGMLSKVIEEAYTISLVEPQLDKVTKSLRSSLAEIEVLKKKINDVKAGRVGADNPSVANQRELECRIPKTKQEIQAENFIKKYELSEEEIKLSNYLISIEPNESNFDYKKASKEIDFSQIKIKGLLENLLDKGAFKTLKTYGKKDKEIFYKQVL